MSSNSVPAPAVGFQLTILHHSLNDTELHRLLKADNYRIKGRLRQTYETGPLFIYLFFPSVSTGTVKNTCIFPQSTAAFMILSASQVMHSSQAHIDSEVSSNLKKFSQLHHKCFVFLLSGLIGTQEQKILSILQEEYLNSDLSFLLAHNIPECAQCMFSIAKVLCKPLSDVIRGRLQRLYGQVCSEDNILAVLSELGIDQCTGIILLDGCGGLAGIARATQRGELVDYNISHSLISSITKVLNTMTS